MKMALVHKATKQIMHTVGPMNPDRPSQPITRDTMFPVGTPGCMWVHCDDDVSPATHNFDGERFVPKAKPRRDDDLPF
jgi:hypothetical protein